MKYDFQFGDETGDQHYSRGSLPLQSVMTHASCFYDDVGDFPVKTCHTITVLDQYINLVKEETAFDVNRFKKLVLVSDGSETQNWSVQVMGNLVRRFREAQDHGFFGNLETLLYIKKSPGHGKVYINLSILSVILDLGCT